jgi:HK97 family phage prohead protease
MKNKVLVSSLKPYGVDIEGLDENAVVERKAYHPVIKLLPDEEKTIIADISTSSLDADGDMVMPCGADLSRFVKNPIVMWSHNYSEPCIGKALEIRSTPNSLEAKIKFADTLRANEIWSLVKGGFLKCNSIGFINQKSLIAGTDEFKEYCKEKSIDGKNCKRIVTKWTLMENSVVNIPSNPDALISEISAKTITLSDKTIKELELKTEPVEPVVINVIKPEEIPVIIVEPKPVDKPKFTIIRDGDLELTETRKNEIVEDRKKELTELQKALRRGKIV